MVDSVNIESLFINHMTWWVFRQKCLTGFHVDVLNCSLHRNRFLVNLYKVLTEYTVINNTHARIGLTFWEDTKIATLATELLEFCIKVYSDRAFSGMSMKACASKLPLTLTLGVNRPLRLSGCTERKRENFCQSRSKERKPTSIGQNYIKVA